MLTVPARIEIINNLHAIVSDSLKTDAQKSTEVGAILAALEENSNVSPMDRVYITQTRDGVNGSRDSLIRTAVFEDCPLTFGKFYKFIAGVSGFSKNHQTYHSYNSFKMLMSGNVKFSSLDPENIGFGPEGRLNPMLVSLGYGGETWFQLFASETELQIDFLRVDAKIIFSNQLLRQGIRLPADTPVAYIQEQDEETGDVRFVCRLAPQ